jgi:hypothetical protein
MQKTRKHCVCWTHNQHAKNCNPKAEVQLPIPPQGEKPIYVQRGGGGGGVGVVWFFLSGVCVLWCVCQTKDVAPPPSLAPDRQEDGAHGNAGKVQDGRYNLLANEVIHAQESPVELFCC